MGTHNGETTISTFEFFKMFPTEDIAIEYFEELRWGEGMYCPHCDSERSITKLKWRPYYLCNDCRKRFTVRTDTVFARSHVPLQKWLYAMYLLETSRKGISSIQLSKQLGVRQATAWFMLHRLREACDVVAEPLEGTVEVDEAFIGGSKKFMHYDKKKLTCPPRTGPVNMLVLGRRKGGKMAKKRHTPEQVINKLREAEVAIAEGRTVAEAARRIGVTEQTFYRWRSEYGGLRIDQARRLKRLESENSRLKRAVADLTLDNQILREASEGNF